MCDLLWNGWTWLIGIPAQFWGPVLAASIAVTGVLVGLDQNTKRQQQQHIFDASQKRTELQLELRREVYLEFATAFQNMQMFLGQLHRKPVDQTDEVAKFSEAMIKLSMVSDIETAKIAHRANSRYMIAYLHISDYSHAPRLALEKAAEQKAKAVLARARAESVAHEIDKFIHAPNYSAAVHKSLQDRLNQFEKNAAICDTEEERSRDEHLQHTVTYIREYIATANALQSDYIDLLVAIRVELGQATNLDEFGNSLNASLEGPLKALKDKIDRLAKEIGTQ